MRDEIQAEVFAAGTKICEQSGNDFPSMFERFRRMQQRIPAELLVRDKLPKSELEEGLRASYNVPPYVPPSGKDEIIAEVRAAREKIAAECGYDMKKLGERLMRLQEEQPENLVAHVPTATVPAPAAHVES